MNFQVGQIVAVDIPSQGQIYTHIVQIIEIRHDLIISKLLYTNWPSYKSHINTRVSWSLQEHNCRNITDEEALELL